MALHQGHKVEYILCVLHERHDVPLCPLWLTSGSFRTKKQKPQYMLRQHELHCAVRQQILLFVLLGRSRLHSERQIRRQ